jgi:hypothetical protein
MRRRSVLHALVASTALSSLAGCNALAGLDSSSSSPLDSTSSPPGESTGAPPGTAASDDGSRTSGEPYRVADAPRLDRPRGLSVRNLGSTERFLTAVVSHDGSELFADSAPVPAGETVSFPGLIASEGEYEVLVETADGDRKRYRWRLSGDVDDLWVDLTPDIDFRRPVLCFTDCPFVTPDENGTVAYDVPADVSVAEALGRTPALALDNDTTERQRATLRIWSGGERRFAASYDLPPDVRALVPVLPASRRYVIILRTDDGETTYDWQPSVRHTLYASLDAEPTFRCGYADHDLVVRNETDVARTVRVRVYTGSAADDSENGNGDERDGETTLFERGFELDAGEIRRVPSAVDPAGPFRFAVETDGTVERYNWVRCAPNGPITVSVSDRGVYVSVRPTGGSG